MGRKGYDEQCLRWKYEYVFVCLREGEYVVVWWRDTRNFIFKDTQVPHCGGSNK